ncbi:MAG: DUF805 domain-containing protein [Rhodomicrobium sp.]
MERFSYVLLSFDGRIKRRTWLVYAAAMIAAEYALASLLRWVFHIPPAEAAHSARFLDDGATILAGLIFLWPSVALDVKRWHDIGKSGWYTLIAYGPIILVYALEAFGFAGQTAVPDPLASATLSILGLIFLVYLIILAARKSWPLANKYGPK